MCNLKDLFCKAGDNYIEGYLDDNNLNPEILFVLKEPDAKSEDVTNFWFKKNVMEDKHGGQKYFETLGQTACKLLDVKNNDYITALKRCAYINIYPFSGKGTETATCKEVVKALRNAKPENGGIIDRYSDKENIEKIANNRKRIILNGGWRYVVTVKGIFEAICPDKSKLFDGFTYGNTKMKAFTIGNTTFARIRHPSRISYEKLRSMLFLCEKEQ